MLQTLTRRHWMSTGECLSVYFSYFSHILYLLLAKVLIDAIL